MSEQTKIDIEKAEKENEGVICIDRQDITKSPYGDNYIHSSNPCVSHSLVKMGWTK